jgi:hypothetical protein
MSSVPPDSDGLEETLESTRESVRRLEMDTYRVRSDLTRLEVALEAIRPRGSESTENEFGNGSPRLHGLGEVDEFDAPSSTSNSKRAEEHAFSTADRNGVLLVGDELCANTYGAETAFPPDNTADSAETLSNNDAFAPAKPVTKVSSPSLFGRVTTPVATSLMLHAVILLAIISITVAAVVHSEPVFTTTILDLGEKPAEHSDNFDLGQLEALDTTNLDEQNDAHQVLQADSLEPVMRDVIPVDFESAIVGPPNPGEEGSVGPPPTDRGTIPAGAGGNSATGTGSPSGSGSGQKRGGSGIARTGGPVGSAMFFGTQTKGNRFVFVVDNSNSMKNGRLEMALAELVKTVESLSPKQSFYVIFVSDQTYPMFYPNPEPELIPATPQNKNRLREWLPKAILASGKNRELIKAMDMAAALQPQAVYLLWDGDLKYSDAVRLDVMTHLTAPNQWNFVVHTIGLGVTSLDGEQNLTAIAQAHHGVFRLVEIPKSRGR